MAGTQLIKSRIKASTVLEVVVAMVIILVVFSIAMTIAARVIQNGTTTQSTRAHALLEDLLVREEQANKFENLQMTTDSVILSQSVSSSIYAGLIVVTMEAHDKNGRALGQLKKIEKP